MYSKIVSITKLSIYMYIYMYMHMSIQYIHTEIGLRKSCRMRSQLKYHNTSRYHGM